MCGINGLVRLDGAEVALDTLRLLNGTMVERGPDEEGAAVHGSVGMAMRRLSIIGLNNGRQPIYNERRTVGVVGNGEIYNYRPVRQDLLQRGHVFNTDSDIEVLVHGFEEWGIEGLLSRVDGMFAFALLDIERSELLLVRDRLGEKPLYYARRGPLFAFASKITSLLALSRIELEINRAALSDYLAVHFVPGRQTVVKDVWKVPPGSFLRLRWARGTPSEELRQYWSLKPEINWPAYPDARSEVRRLVAAAVRSRLIADVPVGVFLSGGIDSTIVVSQVAEVSSGLRTFSIGFDDPSLDESSYAREVAQHFGSEHFHFMFRVAEFRRYLEQAVEHMDEPIGDPAMLPVLLLAQEARRTVKVVLSGEGADEVFGGYSYYDQFAGKVPAARHVRTLARQALAWLRRQRVPSGGFFRNGETMSGFPLLTTADERRRLTGLDGAADHEPWMAALVRRCAACGDPFQRALLADISTWLPEDLLMKLDKMTMGASLEGRAPYLTPALVEYVFALPDAYKVRGGLSKFVLRDAFRESLPPSVASRPKQGFVLPIRRWLRDECRDLMLDGLSYCAEAGLDADALRRLVTEEYERGITRERFSYAILVYLLWFEHVRSARRRALIAC